MFKWHDWIICVCLRCLHANCSLSSLIICCNFPHLWQWLHWLWPAKQETNLSIETHDFSSFGNCFTLAVCWLTCQLDWLLGVRRKTGHFLVCHWSWTDKVMSEHLNMEIVQGTICMSLWYDMGADMEFCVSVVSDCGTICGNLQNYVAELHFWVIHKMLHF